MLKLCIVVVFPEADNMIVPLIEEWVYFERLLVAEKKVAWPLQLLRHVQILQLCFTHFSSCFWVIKGLLIHLIDCPQAASTGFKSVAHSFLANRVTSIFSFFLKTATAESDVNFLCLPTSLRLVIVVIARFQPLLALQSAWLLTLRHLMMLTLLCLAYITAATSSLFAFILVEFFPIQLQMVSFKLERYADSNCVQTGTIKLLEPYTIGI